MNYISLIEELKKRGSIPGLDAIQGLLEELGHPEDDLKIVHIAGGLHCICTPWSTTCRNWVDTSCMVNIIIRKSLFLNLLYRQIAGKLMNNCTNHLNMI